MAFSSFLRDTWHGQKTRPENAASAAKFSWREVADDGGLAIRVPCPGTERTDGQTDNENEECPAEPDMKTSLRNGNGQDGVRFDLTVPSCLEPAAFSSESETSESATSPPDRRTSLEILRAEFRFHSRRFYPNLCAPNRCSNQRFLVVADRKSEARRRDDRQPSLPRAERR